MPPQLRASQARHLKLRRAVCIVPLKRIIQSVRIEGIAGQVEHHGDNSIGPQPQRALPADLTHALISCALLHLLRILDRVGGDLDEECVVVGDDLGRSEDREEGVARGGFGLAVGVFRVGVAGVLAGKEARRPPPPWLRTKCRKR